MSDDLLDQPGWVWWRGATLTPAAAEVVASIDDERVLDGLAEAMRAAIEDADGS